MLNAQQVLLFLLSLADYANQADFITYLSAKYPAALVSRYKIQISDDDSGLDLINKIAIKRGMLLSGGEINLERAAITIIDEFRSGKLGKITLELPEDFSNG